MDILLEQILKAKRQDTNTSIYTESKTSNKLKLSDLTQYPYQFRLIWRSAPNPTLSDDFLELAEANGCIKISCQSYNYSNHYICKDKSSYENLKASLSERPILSGLMELSRLEELNWDEMSNKLPYIFVDRYMGGYSVKFPKKPTSRKSLNKVTEADNSSSWKYTEETTVNDPVFGDMKEGGYYVCDYGHGMTGYIYPPTESEKLYRAKLSREHRFDSLGYNVFIELDSAKEFLDNKAAKLAPVTYGDIKQQLEEIDTHEFLEIEINNNPNLDTTSVEIDGTLTNGDEICLYDSSYIRTQGDIDFIKDQYVKASKEIDHMRKIGYLGAKDE